MPVLDLTNVPTGSEIFIDANIFVYALTGKSGECKTFLERCNKQEVYGYTGVEVVNEVTHVLMLAEALAKKFIPEAKAGHLKKSSYVIKQLSNYWMQISNILKMNICIIYPDENRLHQAQFERTTHALLTNDSIHLASMLNLAVASFASHDDDFDAIPSLNVYKPKDVL